MRQWGGGGATSDLEMYAQKMPYPSYYVDDMIGIIQSQLPLFLMLSFILTVVQTTKAIVLEKERRIKVTSPGGQLQQHQDLPWHHHHQLLQHCHHCCFQHQQLLLSSSSVSFPFLSVSSPPSSWYRRYHQHHYHHYHRHLCHLCCAPLPAPPPPPLTPSPPFLLMEQCRETVEPLNQRMAHHWAASDISLYGAPEPENGSPLGGLGYFPVWSP